MGAVARGIGWGLLGLAVFGPMVWKHQAPTVNTAPASAAAAATDDPATSVDVSALATPADATGPLDGYAPAAPPDAWPTASYGPGDSLADDADAPADPWADDRADDDGDEATNALHARSDLSDPNERKLTAEQRLLAHRGLRGDTAFYSDGTSAMRVGDSTFYSDGTSANRIGESTFYSQGTSANRIGDTTVYSDGVSATQIGDTTMFSDGSSCTALGSTTMCNESHSDEQ